MSNSPKSTSFRWKDYRANDRSKSKIMMLAAGEFIRRFLTHVLPNGFHRIRPHGLIANGSRVENLALWRELQTIRWGVPPTRQA